MGCRWLWLFGLTVAVVEFVRANGGGVTYDGRSLIIDGRRKILFSGSIHYPRSTPDMWKSLISKAKEGGLNAIETYVFWNLHEPKPGQYDFSGRGDIVRFIKEVHAQGLYVCLRIGPFIEGEWSYGGLPFWLHDVPNIIFRSHNKPFEFYMRNFTTKIVSMMKAERLYASQGGPIVLSQIENEYQNVEKGFGDKAPPYVRWAAAMAVGLKTGVPWVMCKQDDAPGPVINSCNGMRCGETFVGPNSPNKPAIWTENWTHFHDMNGYITKIRPVEDIAYQVALFIAKMDGSFINYYMYHGGTNFGRTGASFVITSYYDQAPLDEYGLLRQPKHGHLKELHASVKLCSQTLLYGRKSTFSLGPLQEAYVYNGDKGKCAAFLVNTDARNKAAVQFRNGAYTLAPHSISILPDCKIVAFNTAKVNAQFNTRLRQPAVKLDSPEKWKEHSEVIPLFGRTTLRSGSLLEQMTTTKDASDYLWYTSNYQQAKNSQAVITVRSRGHVLSAFVNGVRIGSGHGSYRNTSFTFEAKVALNRGLNTISLLSNMVGLPDSGAYMEHKTAGLQSVSVRKSQAVEDLSNYQWGYQVGLVGEKLQFYTEEGSNNTAWINLDSKPRPLKWYKSYFDAPAGTDPVALNLGSMGKGEAWVNGESIGRYWLSYLNTAGNPSQTWYHIPRLFLKPTDNHLVLFEEEIGNPLGISVDTVSVTKVCGHVSDSHPPPVALYIREALNRTVHKNQHRSRKPKVRLYCPPEKNISKIIFASFGSPTGDCNSYAVGSCHSINSRAVVERACLGKKNCSVPWSYQRFGGDPCPGIPKSLLIEAQCQ